MLNAKFKISNVENNRHFNASTGGEEKYSSCVKIRIHEKIYNDDPEICSDVYETEISLDFDDMRILFDDIQLIEYESCSILWYKQFCHFDYYKPLCVMFYKKSFWSYPHDDLIARIREENPKFRCKGSLDLIEEAGFVAMINSDIQEYENIFNSRNLNISRLALYDCKKIENISDYDSFRFLQKLHLFNIDGRLRLDNTFNLPALKEIIIDSNTRVRSIDNSFVIPSLETLIIKNCRELDQIKGIENLKNLKKLHLENAHKIFSFEVLQNLIQLESLYISGSDTFTDASCLVKSKKLKSLSIIDCALKHTAYLDKLYELEELCLDRSDLIKDIEYIGHRFYLHYGLLPPF